MNRRWKGAVAALVTALTLTIPALGVEIIANGTALPDNQAWVKNGTSYITLRAYSMLTDCILNWDGDCARLTGCGLTLEAQPGQLYVTANDRALYVEDGVQVVDGKLALPLRVVAQAAGADLSWNSATGTAALNTAGSQAASAAYDEDEVYWLSRVISAESRGESLLGQIAVGNVVLNRVKSSQFPDTVKDVVFDTRNGIQFEPTANGSIYQQPTEAALLAAKLCLEGANVVGNSLYFYAPTLSSGTWIVNNYTYYTTIGCHRFYQ